MTLHTKECFLSILQFSNVGPMRYMADHAIILCRWMHKDKWATFLLVALEACVVHGDLVQQSASGGTMRVVAVGAFHFPFTNWMVGSLIHLPTHVDMACVASVSFIRFSEGVSVTFF